MPAHRSARLPQRESSSARSAAAEPRVLADFLTVDELCAELRITRSTFNDWRAKRCAPPCVRLPNRQLRFRRAELDHWLDARADVAG
jgi:predicted DNA-binding transcriptional regulator AlpA